MSVRKRTWKTASGETKEAWVVDYVDQAGKRRLKTFKRKKEADAYHSRANVEVSEGTHTADGASVTVTEAAALWLKSCSGLERATVTAYKQHVDIHIIPMIGKVKLSQLTASSSIIGPLVFAAPSLASPAAHECPSHICAPH